MLINSVVHRVTTDAQDLAAYQEWVLDVEMKEEEEREGMERGKDSLCCKHDRIHLCTRLDVINEKQ
jgi:hypothetical protein